MESRCIQAFPLETHQPTSCSLQQLNEKLVEIFLKERRLDSRKKYKYNFINYLTQLWQYGVEADKPP